MGESYKSVIIKVDVAQYEILSAMLSQFPFESFYEADDALIGYFADEMDEVELRCYLDQIKSGHNFSYTIESIQEVNWNAEWESNFDPIYVDAFVCIRADFHEPPLGVTHDIIINPKMSFGTGHHETTFMMMQKMEKLNFSGKTVLDLGCGTSILAILAEKMGAQEIFAIDYDEKCVINSKENIATNQCAKIAIAEGTIDDVPHKKYDVILANINRAVLLSVATQLSAIMNEEGQLLLSGILKVDEELVLEKYRNAGFRLIDINQRGEWLCISLKCDKAL